jgi:hypothetical protein
MLFIKILITSLVIYTQTLCPERNVLKALKGYSYNNFPNAKVFIPYIFSNEDNEASFWSYRAVGYIRGDANITSRNCNRLQIPDVVSFFPTQKSPDTFTGDKNATPFVSCVDPVALLGGLFNIERNNHKIDIYIAGNFCGFNIGSGIMTLENAYLLYRYKKHNLLLGQYISPMRFEYNAPRVVSYNFGAPLASRVFNPQIFYTYNINNIGLSFIAYTQFLFCSWGPVRKGEGLFSTAIPNYQQWSLLPAINIRATYDNHCDFKGIISLDVKTIKPFIYTQFHLGINVPCINNNSVSSFVVSSFFKLQRNHAFITSQIMYGNNAMDFYTFGGYGIRYFDEISLGQKTFNKTTYAPTYFCSGWLSLETTKINKHFVPGIFIGYGTTLGSKFPLQFGAYGIETLPPQPVVYSIDSRYANEEFMPIGVKTLNSLVRISPRIWTYCNDHLLIGTEIELSYASFGYVDQYGIASTCSEKVPMIRSIISTQFAF